MHHKWDTFNEYQSDFKPNKTNFDWISREEKEIEDYIGENCGHISKKKTVYSVLTLCRCRRCNTATPVMLDMHQGLFSYVLVFSRTKRMTGEYFLCHAEQTQTCEDAIPRPRIFQESYTLHSFFLA